VGNALFEPILQCVSRYTATVQLELCVRLLYACLRCVQIVIPFLVVTCTFSAIHVAVNVPTQSLVLVVLLMSDFMAVVSQHSPTLLFIRLICRPGLTLSLPCPPDISGGGTK